MRLRICVGLMMWLGMLPASLGASESPRETVTPVVRSSFPVGFHDSVAVSPDLKHVYITREDVPTLNLWQVIASRWIELAGVLLLIGLYLLLRRLLRLWRQRGLVDVPFCRRCEYRLDGIQSDKCPECGGSIARYRQVGRPIGLRVIVLAGVSVALAGGWIAAELLLPPQFQQWRGPSGYSDALHGWAKQRQVDWLLRLEVTTSVVEQHQADGGALVHRIRIAQEDTEYLKGPWPVRISKDSQRIFLQLGFAVDVYDATTGRKIRRLDAPADADHLIAAWESADGLVLSTARQNKLARWDSATGRSLPTIALPGNNFFIHEIEATGQFVMNDDWKAYVLLDSTGQALLRVTDVAPDAGVLEFYPDGKVSPDGSRLYAPQSRMVTYSSGSGLRMEPAIGIFDLANGKRVDSLHVGSGVKWIALTRDGSGLITGADAPTLHLWNVATHTPVRRIQFSGITKIRRYWTSADERTAIVLGDSPGGAGNRVLLVDLASALAIPTI